MISLVSLPDWLISRTLLYLATQYAHGKAIEYVYEILEGKKHVETVSERRMTEGRKTERRMIKSRKTERRTAERRTRPKVENHRT